MFRCCLVVQLVDLICVCGICTAVFRLLLPVSSAGNVRSCLMRVRGLSDTLVSCCGGQVGQEQAASGDPQGCLVANTFRDWCARQPDAQLEHWLNVHMGVVEVRTPPIQMHCCCCLGFAELILSVRS